MFNRHPLCGQLLLVLLLGSTVLFVGCKKDPPPPPSLPEGVQTLTGTLLPTELSLLRRGTHLFRIEGEDAYFAESAAVNLSRHEGKEMVVEGTLSPNVDATFLPVLDVQKIVRVLEEDLKEWKLQSLGVTLSTPESWNGSIQEEFATFRLIGEDKAILTVTSDDPPEELPDGVPVVIDKERAVRVVDEQSGQQIVYLDRGTLMLIFTFDPSEHESPDSLREDWLKVLQTIKLAAKEDVGVDIPSTGTGNALGKPCGGPAGILCPAGFYCDVTHLEENIGTCKRL